VELYPTALNYSSRIFNALKHVVVICSTGLGQLADMEPANALMRTAVNYRYGFCGDSMKFCGWQRGGRLHESARLHCSEDDHYVRAGIVLASG